MMREEPPQGSGPDGEASKQPRRPASADRATGRKRDRSPPGPLKDPPASPQTPFPGDDAGRPPSEYPSQMDR
jgi:hypothetical protein